MSHLVGQCVVMCLLLVFWQGHSFLLSGKGLSSGFFKRPTTAANCIANEATVGSLDILRKHLMDKTVCLAVFPKSAFTDAKILGLRQKFATEHTWNSFLTKEQVTKLVMGKFYCPVLQHATAKNWCIFMEQRLVDVQYKRLAKFISMEYDLSPEPVDATGRPMPSQGMVRHKFMFCKKYHMIILDGVPKGQGVALPANHFSRLGVLEAREAFEADAREEEEESGDLEYEESDEEEGEGQYGDLTGEDDKDGDYEE